MSPRMRLREDAMDRALGLLEADWSMGRVGGAWAWPWHQYHLLSTSPSPSSMNQICSNMVEVESPKEGRFLRLMVLRDPTTSSGMMQIRFWDAPGVSLSRQTARNRMPDSRLRSRWPAVQIPLRLLHRQLREEWCQEHLYWTSGD